MGDTEHESIIMSSPTPIRPDLTKTGGETVKKEQSTSIEYEQSLQIVLGTVCGVFGLLGLLLILSLLYRLYKKRQARLRGAENRDHELNSSISIDMEQKQTPTVLLLYAYDCVAHEKVVSSLAGYLIETCNCNVHVDLFEDQIITDRGLDDWLVDRLQEADFILVLCSIGARLRCTKKRVRFKLDPYRRIPDYFAVAVDYVAEKMRVERSKGLPMSRFINIYFDYSTSSDIPHQLEMGTKFCLMRDISKLFCHIHGFMSDTSKCSTAYPAISDKYFENSELGLELKVAIDSAKEFFRCNPNWVEDSMEFLPPPTSKSKTRLHRKSSLEPLLPSDEGSKDVIEKTQEYLDTTADVYHHSLPPYPDNLKESVPALQSRQNSLPSSLSSKGLSTPSPPPHTSKSYDNFRGTNRYSANIETMRCIVCGQVEHHNEQMCTKGPKLCQNHLNVNEGEDDDSSLGRLKSKSMPTVCPPGFHSSQTVLKADVHKEWGEQEPPIPIHRGSFSDSQDSGSCKDVAMEDLERDLQSIIMPPHAKSEPNPTFQNHEGSSQYIRNLSLPTSGGANFTQKLSNLPVIPTHSKSSSASSSIGSLEERLRQFQDIRL